jgi:hypothetical protein
MIYLLLSVCFVVFYENYKLFLEPLVFIDFLVLKKNPDMVDWAIL